MNKKSNSRSNVIVRHKTGILVAAVVVTTTAAVMMRYGIKQHDDFLRANDLYEKFYGQFED